MRADAIIAAFTFWVSAGLVVAPGVARGQEALILQSTTSTAHSGLYDHLLPLFYTETGITVHVVAVGTGQAMRNAQNCDGDVLLVHATRLEEQFVAAGYGTARYDVMFNDYVIIGPPEDPAHIWGSKTAHQALAKIAAAGALFASRGDDSGTHQAELTLWDQAGVDPSRASGRWYRETGAGMGATLNTGIGMGAYVLTDRATWISFGNKQDHIILVQGDRALRNQYGVIPVSPTHCPNANITAAQAFADWLVSPKGQTAITTYRIADHPLFVPNATAD